MKFSGGVDLAFQDELFGHFPSDPPAQKAVGAHAGKKVEYDFRQAKTCAAFRDQNVKRQGMFKTAAKRVTLYQRHGDDRRTECVVIGILHPHASFSVAAHRGQVAGTYTFGKMTQIAAQIVDARGFRTAYKVTQIIRPAICGAPIIIG